MRRTLIAGLLACAVAVGVVTPAAAEEPVSPTVAEVLADLLASPPTETTLAVEARFAALEALYGLDVAGEPANAQRSFADARDAFASTSDWFGGDRIVDARLFDADQTAARELMKLAASTGYAEPLAALVEADRMAVEAEHEAYVEAARLAGLEAGGVEHRYQQKLEQFAEHRDGEQWHQAIESLHQAWRIVDGEFAALLAESDADADGLFAWQEEQLGTSGDVADTDGDGLSDLVEIIDTYTDPTRAETTPGVPDGDSDLDGDGLDARTEVALGTLTTESDSDGDGLDDGFEHLEFGSDPTLVDTDSDGLEDDSEHRLGTDPTNPDTDGDGVLDGDEVYTTHREGDGYALAITGVGDVADAVEIADKSASPQFAGAAALRSPAIDFTTERAFTNANVTFPVAAGLPADEDPEDYAIGYLDEATGLLTPLETSFDPTTSSFSAATDHFTTFVLFYVPTWQAALSTVVPGTGVGGTVGLDAAFVLDSSGSMTTNDRYGYRRTAAKSFVDAMIDGDRVTVVDFDGSARVYYALGEDFEAAKVAIDRVDSSGGTNIGAGVSAGISQLLTSDGRDERAQVLILLTDGQGSYSSSLTTLAADNGIQIFTVGLGSGVNASLLTQIADATDGQYFAVADAADLPNVFSRILDDLGDQDTDGDGLLDRWELGGMATGASGTLVYSDPTRADSDGDGLLDSEEITYSSSPLVPAYFHLRSIPTEVDSDGDGLGDAEERELGMWPLDDDHDGDGLSDGDEHAMAMDPAHRNPDGDRFDDAAELAGETDPFTYDVTVGDRVRAFAAGAVLGEVGYWFQDRGTSFEVKVTYTPLPTLVVPQDGWLDWCDIWVCTDLTDFRPVYADQVEYVIAMIVGGFIPFVDIVVFVRDTVGAALQGEWGWAAFELGAGALGFFYPIVGDLPGVAKDIVKWAKRSAYVIKRQNAALRALAKLDDVSGEHIARLLWLVDWSAAWKMATKGGSLDADDLKWIVATGRQSATELANALGSASSVRKVATSTVAQKPPTGWFDVSWRTFGRRGAEAEQFVHANTGGAATRLVANGGEVRYVDSLATVAGRTVATEVKTGDAKLTSFIQRQIDRDVLLRSQGRVDEVRWEFFPSRGGGRTGPDAALIEALQNAGIEYVVWVP